MTEYSIVVEPQLTTATCKIFPFKFSMVWPALDTRVIDMATADEKLREALNISQFRALNALLKCESPIPGSRVASQLGMPSSTTYKALAGLLDKGFATYQRAGQAKLWQLNKSNRTISEWVTESKTVLQESSLGSSPYSTGGGGVRLEQTYAACLVSSFLSGDVLPELGDAITPDLIRLQASDVSDADDIVLEGRDTHGQRYRASIAVRRSPSLNSSDSASVPLIRDFLSIVMKQWTNLSSGNWRLVLAVSSNARAITELAELAELAHSLPGAAELTARLSQSGRTNDAVRKRYGHLKRLVENASKELINAEVIDSDGLTWRLLYGLRIRNLRLERTDRTDRTIAINSLQRTLIDGTPAMADALFSRLEELIGEWAPQAAILTQSVIRQSLGNFRLTRPTSFASAWRLFDRLGAQLRESCRPALRSGEQTLELERPKEKTLLTNAISSAGISTGALCVTGDPDVGKSALSLRIIEALEEKGASAITLSLKDLPESVLELEGLLDYYSVEEVLGAATTGGIRILLIDGAESVLEGKGQMFRSIAAAGLKAGFGIVGVTRTDASHQVVEELSSALAMTGSQDSPSEYIVKPLSGEELLELPRAFKSLRRLSNDPRTQRVLRRLGLVDALLRSGVDLEPVEILSEVDVYSAVWQKLIRKDEKRNLGTASPDDREQTTLIVARQALGIPADPISGLAAAELRSNGVLQVPSNFAFAARDEFATDLFRDFALCKLFITQGWGILKSVGAPRWSIRAASLGCQALLHGTNRLESWNTLKTEFSAIADELGDRWLEVPYESLLTLGDAEEALRELWESLTDNNYAGLDTLLRIAENRYVQDSIGDPFAIGPLVRILFCEQPQLDHVSQFDHRNISEVIQELVLAWLRGMVPESLQPSPLRQDIRDVILSIDPPLFDEFAIEALACLGIDIDERTVSWLQKVSNDAPESLNAAVESSAVSVSMSEAHPKLLLELTESYFIKAPNAGDHFNDRSIENGIRDYYHGSGLVFGAPGAAWYYGPFFQLLNAIPLESIAFINRMLDHAAKVSVGHIHGCSKKSQNGATAVGVSLALIGHGEQLYFGDGQVWSWYRGTSVGPYPCMSALLALEQFIDRTLDDLDIPVDNIFKLLLRDCNNLAVPGLLVGFLTRHPDQAGELLDLFFEHPEIWHLESSRVSGEYFHVRDPDADKLAGLEFRKWTPHQTVADMVIRANINGDRIRLSKLEAVGARLVENAKSAMIDGESYSDYLTMVEGWASMFRVENYHVTTTPDGTLIEFKRPSEIDEALTLNSEEFQKVDSLHGLQLRYGRHNDAPENWPIEYRRADIDLAMQLEADSSLQKHLYGSENPLVPVAAAAVYSHAMGLVHVHPSELRWAVSIVLKASENPKTNEKGYSDSIYTLGSDRAAAVSVPLLLLPAFDDLNLDRKLIESSLRALCTSASNEVRAFFTIGALSVWGAPCDFKADTSHCLRHAALWTAAISGLSDCSLGEWNPELQRQEIDTLRPPFHESLTQASVERILVTRLRMPLSCMFDARNTSCLQNDIITLWSPLWEVHRSGLAHWWAKSYERLSQHTHEPIARRMIELVLEGDGEIVKSHIETLAENSNSLCKLFEGFAIVFTHNEGLRKNFTEFWPWAFKIALDSIGDGSKLRTQRYGFDDVTAALLPTPTPRHGDPDIDRTLGTCRTSWIQPEALGDVSNRWLELASGQPKAVDAVVQLAKCTSIKWQTTVALDWIRTIIGDNFRSIANRCWYLNSWLGDVRRTGSITGDFKIIYERIVDGLASAGDRKAVELQKLEE